MERMGTWEDEGESSGPVIAEGCKPDHDSP
jgi:hypothetical protein